MSITAAKLSNGLRVVTDRVDSVESVSLGVWVDVGTRNESAEANGVSHLLEHMAFKGTGRRSAFDIACEIEDVGGYLNAYTSGEATVYHASVLKQHVPLAIDIIADILLNSTFDEAELARERSVVLQEIGQAADTPEDVVFDWFQETAYPDQPLGRPVMGTADTVGRMSRRTLIDYMASQYGSDRMILAAAGNLDHDRILRLAEDAFGSVARTGAGDPAPASYAGGDRRMVRDLEQAHLALGFDGVGFADADYYPLSVLSTALGGGASSRLFQEVREKRGLVYSIHPFASHYADGGVFGIYAGTGPAEISELVAVVCDEIVRVASDPVTEPELVRARTQMRAGILMALESTTARAERLARQMQICDRILPVDEIVELIEAVSAEDVRRVARRLVASPPTLAALGPVQGLEDYESVRKRLTP